MENQQQHDGQRVRIIEAVTTPLGFFVLIVLVVEGVLGTVAGVSAGRGEGLTATVTVVGMLVVIMSLIGVVAYVAYYRPHHLGVGRPHSVTAEQQEFCRLAAGYWWGWADPGLVGFVTLWHDKLAGTLTMKGVSYDGDANVRYIWESAGSCISRSGNKLNYCWNGRDEKPTDRGPIQWREGFGEISFNVFGSDPIDSAVSWFFDTNIADVTDATKKSSTFKRCSTKEEETMRGNDRKEIARLVKQKLAFGRQVT